MCSEGPFSFHSLALVGIVSKRNISKLYPTKCCTTKRFQQSIMAMGDIIIADHTHHRFPSAMIIIKCKLIHKKKTLNYVNKLILAKHTSKAFVEVNT